MRTLDAVSAAPLADVFVSFPDHGQSRYTDSLGVVAAPRGLEGRIRVGARLLGYADLDTTFAVPPPGATVDLLLARSAVELPPLTVEAERAGANSRDLAREMFEREVAVGALGVTQTEVDAVPAIGEADVFRSLESFSGVTNTTDYTTEMYVRGGDFDQIAVLFEGAPVFGPYHMLGMFGLFNGEAVESVEFYRGAIPTRYGGSLSGVLDVRQRVGTRWGTRFSGGLSLLGLRLAAGGSAPWADGEWLAAGRRATIALSALEAPYSFQDFNLGIELHPREEHRVDFSLLATNDEFNWAIDFFGGSVDAKWTNLVSSVTWSWVRGNSLTTDATAYASGYDVTLGIGREGTAPTTRNRVAVAGVRGQVTVRGDRTGIRAGLVAEGGPVSILGTEPGAYFGGEAESTYLHGFLFAEVEQWIGPLRLGPGVRVGGEGSAARAFVEPRLSARLYLGPLAVSASLDRAHQFRSVLRDDRFIFPGPPVWSVRERGEPIPVAEGFSVAADYWRAERWTASAGFWARRLRNMPRWRPERLRDLSALEHHHGRAHGWEVSLQRHGTHVLGWASYQWSKVTLEDSQGREYLPTWDRQHEFDATLAVREVFGASVSLRARVATGTPFWYPAGTYYGLTYNPVAHLPGLHSPDNPPSGLDYSDATYTILSDVQGRLPYYGRVDLSLRYAFRWGTRRIEPFASVPNITGRENVYGVWPTRGLHDVSVLPPGLRYAGPLLQLPPIPSIGIDFRF